MNVFKNHLKSKSVLYLFLTLILGFGIRPVRAMHIMKGFLPIG